MDFYRSAPTTLRNYLEQQWPQDDSFQECLRKMRRDQHEWGVQMDVIAAATAYDVNIRCISTVGPHGQCFDELVRALLSDGSPIPAATTSPRILYSVLDLYTTNMDTHLCKHLCLFTYFKKNFNLDKPNGHVLHP